MTTGLVGFMGGTPKVEVGTGNPEALKYGEMWKHAEYRAVAPGEGLAQVFLHQARPRGGAEVIDFGCGTGRGALMMAILGRVRVTMIDFVNNCLDPEIKAALKTQADVLRFVKADLEKKLPVAAEYGFCTDVMEHIPPDKVDIVLNNILKSAQHVFFAIATSEDICGKIIGQHLHLSVHPYGWWLQQFAKRQCVIHWSREEKGMCVFYLSAWSTGHAVVDSGKINTEQEQIRANVKYNCAQGWTQIEPHEANNLEAMILGGGPSMSGYVEDIKSKRADGVKLITLNGAYNWALQQGLVPSAQIIVDARKFNARFTKPVIENCKYLLCSQCDPSVFEGLPKDQTYIFHTSTEHIKDILKDQYKDEIWWGVPGGTTVLLRAIPLLRMLGYRRFHLYGCDSCLYSQGDFGRDPLPNSPIVHHAYSQPENDSEFIVAAKVTGGRIFQCHPWMITQAQEMMYLIKYFGNEIDLEIHGDGLLRHILMTGAEMADEVIATAEMA